MRPRIPRPSPALLVAGLALTVAAAGGAVAQTGGGGAVIQGCVSRTGALELITPENPSCEATQSPVSWNQQGLKGDKGDPGDRVSAETTAIDQHADDTLADTKLPKAKVPAKLLPQLLEADPAPGEAYQVKRTSEQAIPDWYQQGKYTMVSRLALPKGRWSIHAKALAHRTASASQYPDSYAGRVRCVLSSPKGGDVSESQGTLALQMAVRFTKVTAAELHCTGWGAAISTIKMVGIRLRAIETLGS